MLNLFLNKNNKANKATACLYTRHTMSLLKIIEI